MEIMRRLYVAGERGQLELCMIYAQRAIEEIDAKQPPATPPAKEQPATMKGKA